MAPVLPNQTDTDQAGTGSPTGSAPGSAPKSCAPAGDPSAGVATDASGELHLPDDRFIPLRSSDLAALIAADTDTFGPAAGHASAFLEAIDAVIDQEITSFGRTLQNRYASINPDRDTMPGPQTSAADTDEAEGRMIDALTYVFDKASYERLDDVQIESAVRIANSHGLKVRIDPDGIESLSIWVRGRGTVTRRKRTVAHPVRGETFELDVYLRLAVAARVRGEDALRLKLYREIPVADLEALLPHARVTMSMIDRLQVFGGGAGALGGVAFKLPAVIATGIAGIASLGNVLLIALGGLVVKSFMGWRRNKQSRRARRTQHLYEQHMAANAAVLDAVLVQIEEEEIKEALLAWAVLAATGGGGAGDDGEGRDVERVRDRAERWLRGVTGRSVRFDAEDGLETLCRLGLVEDGRLIDGADHARAIERLWSIWRGWTTRGYHLGILEQQRCARRERKPGAASGADQPASAARREK